jgi:hypothetical protein
LEVADIAKAAEILQIGGSAVEKWRNDPVQMVRDLFDVEPDAWQADALRNYPTSKRMVMKACTGPGKSAVLAWIGWNFLLTRPNPAVGATSISKDNLKANLWTELARWRSKSTLLQQLFEQTKETIFLRERPATWKLEARTWAKDADATQIGNALRGLHAEYVMWLLDETGDYPDSILPITEAIFSGSPVEAHIIQAGNPVKRAGPLYLACTGARKLWYVVEITADPDDPNRTPRVSVEHAQEQIDLWGRDNPYVMVSILGRFPPTSFNALIGEDEVRESMKRYYRAHEIGQAPKILGVDVARFGDDASSIAPRQGIQMMPLHKFRNLDSTQGAGHTARIWDEWGADACFLDATGGYGSGWEDQLRLLGKTPVGINFSQEASNKARYFNKRAEMAFEFVNWIKRGGALPFSKELLDALTMTTYSFQKDKLLLEPKEIVKKNIGCSPDEFDSCILTFAHPVAAKSIIRQAPRREEDYNPFRENERFSPYS